MTTIDIFWLAALAIGILGVLISAACGWDELIEYSFFCCYASTIYFAGPHIIAILWGWGTSQI